MASRAERRVHTDGRNKKVQIKEPKQQSGQHL
jgi:hypothetical protein